MREARVKRICGAIAALLAVGTAEAEPPPGQRGRLGLTAAALLAAGAGWYYGSPWWTLWRMREAARAGDVANFSTYVDAPALAERTKARARTRLGSVLTTALDDSDNSRRFVALARRRLAELERRGGDAPAGLLGWLSEMPVRRGGLGGYRTRNYDPVVIRHGLDRFDLRDRRASVEYGPVLSFRRHGLGWKLEDAQWGQQ
jgi:hypothetical protein